MIKIIVGTALLALSSLSQAAPLYARGHMAAERGHFDARGIHGRGFDGHGFDRQGFEGRGVERHGFEGRGVERHGVEGRPGVVRGDRGFEKR